jgi:hypothetical protein
MNEGFYFRNFFLGRTGKGLGAGRTWIMTGLGGMDLLALGAGTFFARRTAFRAFGFTVFFLAVFFLAGAMADASSRP